MASRSKMSVTHPPRTNPPLRSSSGPPSPCITPSTETLVLVVSFMTSVPFSLGLSLWAALRRRPLTPTTNASGQIRHRLPDFFRDRSEPTTSRSRGSLRTRLLSLLSHKSHPRQRMGASLRADGLQLRLRVPRAFRRGGG